MTRRNQATAEPDRPGEVQRGLQTPHFIRTLKENLPWARIFTIENLRLALPTSRETCDTIWRIERHGSQTQAARQLQLQPAALAT
jgi:hypothetical protein